MILDFIVTALILVVILFISYLIIKITSRKSPPEEEPEPTEILYTFRLHQFIMMVSHLDYQLQMIDDLICNIKNGCDEDVLHTVSVNWKWFGDDDSKQIEFPCYMYSKDYLLKLCYARKRELLNHLSYEINNLPIRYGKNMDDTLFTSIADNLSSVGEGSTKHE